MSYISGFMLGSAIGKGIFDFLHGKGKLASLRKSVQTPFYLKSDLQGRRRYYSECLVKNPHLADLLQKELIKISYIKKVEINVLTGSFLILYEERADAKLDHLIKLLSERIFSGQKEQKLISSSKEGLSLLGESIRRSFHAFNQKILQKTHGYIDLRTLFSLAFVFRGLRRVLLYRDRVSGWQLMWWAFSLLSIGKIRMEDGISFN